MLDMSLFPMVFFYETETFLKQEMLFHRSEPRWNMAKILGPFRKYFKLFRRSVGSERGSRVRHVGSMPCEHG